MSGRGWAAVAVGVLVAAGPGPERGAKELDRLRGEWTFVRWVTNGRERSEEEMEERRVFFDGATVTFRQPNLPDEKARIVLDPTTSPALIDLTYLEGRRKGQTVEGIYRLEGDTLSLCLNTRKGPPKHRPLEFASTPGSSLILYVLKRAGP